MEKQTNKQTVLLAWPGNPTKNYIPSTILGYYFSSRNSSAFGTALAG